MELHGQRNGPTHDAGDAADLQARAAATSTCAPAPPCASPTSAPTSAAPTGRSTSWPASSCGWSRPDGSLGDVVRTSPKLNYCVRDLERTGRASARPTTATTPAATRTRTIIRDTLGTSVGWSDIYPADYDKQWIDVSGLRGCFAFPMTVDPKHLPASSRTSTTTPRTAAAAAVRPARLPSATLVEADAGEGARQVAFGDRALAEDLPVAAVVDRGDVDDGRGQAAQLAAVDRQVDARRGSSRGRPRSGRRRVCR